MNYGKEGVRQQQQKLNSKTIKWEKKAGLIMIKAFLVVLNDPPKMVHRSTVTVFIHNSQTFIVYASHKAVRVRACQHGFVRDSPG